MLLSTQLLNFGLFFGSIFLAVIVLFHTQKDPLSDKIATAIWVTIIIRAPILGAVAFFIVRPSHVLIHSRK